VWLLDWAKNALAYGKRIATLEARVTTLEADLHETHPAQVCEFCGRRGMRKTLSYDPTEFNEKRKEVWTCRECGRSEDRIVRF
jgi:hypothetical protein